MLYHCFCSSERLDQLRKENQLLKQPIKYDRHCLKTLDKQKRVQLAESGQPHILRFYVRSQNELIVLNDIIRNDVSWDSNLIEYRKKGLLPETMINFMALLGWALDDKTEFFSYHELVDSFSLDRVTKSGAIFDFDKLNWMNGAYIRALSIDDLLERSLPYLERTFIDGGLHDDVKRPIDKEYLREILVLVQERIKTLDELTYMTSIFFLDIVDYEGVEWEQNQWTIDDIKSSLESVLSEFRSINSWELDVIEKTLRALAENLDVKAGRLFGLLRLVVTGRPSSPPLFQMLHVLGKKRTCNRVETVLSIIGAE